MRFLILSGVLAAVAFILPACSGPATQVTTYGTDVKLIASETRLGEATGLLGMAYRECFEVSPDKRHVAQLLGVDEGRRWRVSVDGVEGPIYDDIADHPDFSAVFSPDSSRFAYAAKQGTKERVILNGREQPLFDLVYPCVFSPDSRHVAYVAQRGEKWVAVIDGKPGNEYDEIVTKYQGEDSWRRHPGVRFGADSRHWAYIARRGNEMVAVMDGVEGKPCDGVGAISPDARRFAMAVFRDQELWINVDGVERGPYEHVSGIQDIFSPDSRRTGFAACRAGKWFAVIDGVEGPAYDAIYPQVSGDDGLTFLYFWFSPDSKHTAYMAGRGNKSFVVRDGVEGQAYDQVGFVTFSPDSNRLAYVATRGNRNGPVADDQGEPDESATAGKRKGPQPRPTRERPPQESRSEPRDLAVIDGKEGPEFTIVGRIVFSPDSRRTAYAAYESGDDYARDRPMIDGKPGKPCELVDDIAFSPDSMHVAYAAKYDKGGKEKKVLDGVEYDWSDMPSGWFGPFFTTAFRHGVRWNEGHFEIDGVVGPQAPSHVFAVAATGPDSLVALVVRDWNLYRVEITVVGPPAAGAPAMAP